MGDLFVFGISFTEFLVIILVAICVIPAKYWPDVAKFFGKLVKVIREFIWKLTDMSEQIKQRIDLEKPIDDLIAHTTKEVKKIVKTKKLNK